MEQSSAGGHAFSGGHKDYRLAAIMFTDIVGFSRMMEEDERGTLKTLDFHNKLVREQVEKHRGTVIKTIGDAFLAQFNTTLDAVECSLSVQEGIREYNEAKLGKPLTLRIGVHLGDIYFYENDALGEGINIASRLQSVTKPGHITISREVYSQVSGKIPMRVESMGQVHLKNITREVHAYEIIPGGEDNNSSASRKSPEAVVASPPEAASDFQSLRLEWRSLRDEVAAHHRDEGADEGESWNDLKHEFRAQLRAEIREARDAWRHQAEASPPAPTRGFADYKAKKLKQARHAKGGFVGHLIPYLSVNGFLFFLWSFLTPGAHPWFLYPLMGWGIGLVSHWAGVKSAVKSAREVENLEDLPDDEYRELKKYQDARAGFYGHLSSNAMVCAFLYAIWFVTGADFPWYLFPVGAIAVGVLSHAGSFAARHASFKELKRSWKRSGRVTRRAAAPPPPPVDEDPRVTKARTLKDSILAQASAMKGGHPFGDEMGPTLENYVLQIAELSTIERDLGQVVAGFDPRVVEAEAETVRAKIASTGSETLRAEYSRSLEGLEKQARSYTDLAEQQEILGLKIKGALGNLQQMQVDLARIKGLADGQNGAQFLPIKERSEELSRYIEDYRVALKEIPE